MSCDDMFRVAHAGEVKASIPLQQGIYVGRYLLHLLRGQPRRGQRGISQKGLQELGCTFTVHLLQLKSCSVAGWLRIKLVTEWDEPVAAAPNNMCAETEQCKMRSCGGKMAGRD